MFSRDIEVHSLNIESQRLVYEAEKLMRELRKHQSQLNNFVDEARQEIPAKSRVDGAGKP